jgi:hypothetical protein
MRVVVSAMILFVSCGGGFCQDVTPAWLNDATGFCKELAKRTNVEREQVPFGRPQLGRFADYPARPVAPPRAEKGILGKYDWMNAKSFSRAVRTEIAKGPDFAGRYAILKWTCGSWCANATIADIRTGKTYETPFVGVVGCSGVTGDFDTLQHQADSSLLIVRGLLEMPFGDRLAADGPCGTFFFRWVPHRLQLIGCDIASESSKGK